jgi:hypothetical protein
MSQDHDTDGTAGVSRRAFFGTAVGAAAAGAAATMGGARPVIAQQTGTDRTRARYQATEHVENYYRTNRYTRTEG